MKNKRDLLDIRDLSKTEIYKIFEQAKFFKYQRKKHITITDTLKGMCIGLLFRKPSSRTRISFEVAIIELGGNPMFLEAGQLQISRGETIYDTARVLNLYLSGLVIRTYQQSEVETFAKYVDFPVVNALTDLFHPCQILADFFTIWEVKKNLEDAVITYIGDANNICNTLILGADILGIKINVSCPQEFSVSEEIIKSMKNPSLLNINNDPSAFISESDVIYTDTWVSMGNEQEKQRRLEIFRPYQVNEKLVQNAREDFIFMHCLPAHRGEEVTDEIIDGKNSVVWQQAENRLHVQKAILHFLYSG
ncbi:MAG TPA: ornithine carbamoyltransferase [bacterium]|nr:ornithine carbamoyltransferase [bacterium]HPO51878.1 ornithine carbamoyltransferase [bacterium]